MKVGMELEFLSFHDLNDSFEKEYYDNMWEKSDYLFEGTPTLCVRQLRKWVAEAVTIMPSGSVFNTNRSIGRAIYSEGQDAHDNITVEAFVWTGLHIHVEAKGKVPMNSIARKLSIYLSNLFVASERQRSSHHIWGHAASERYPYDYQRKRFYNPVSARPIHGTYEIRIMDFNNLLHISQKMLTSIFQNIQRIINSKPIKVDGISHTHISNAHSDSIFMNTLAGTLLRYSVPEDCRRNNGWLYPMAGECTGVFRVSKGFLREVVS